MVEVERNLGDFGGSGLCVLRDMEEKRERHRGFWRIKIDRALLKSLGTIVLALVPIPKN